MNKTNEIIGHFEQLPDEILFDIFENYIRLIDLYYGFYFLDHRRISQIIKSARFHIALPSKDIFHTKSFTQFSPQIISLHLTIFCGDLDLTKLVNLRFLHIEKPTRSQLVSIRAENLPHLSYLSLSSCWYCLDEVPRTLTDINLLYSFEHLRICVLPNGKSIRLSLKHSSSTTCINSTQ